MRIFDSKEDIEHVAKSIDNTIIAENEYTLSVSSYVVPKDNQEKINIMELNEEVSKTVEKINKLRGDIDSTIKEIEA